MKSTSASELVLLHSEPGSHAFYTWQNIMIACWSQRATGPAIEKIGSLRAAMHDRHPEGVSVIYLIADGAGLPTPEARAGVRELMVRFSQHRACLAILVQGGGFWASAMRAVITGVRLLVPLKFAMGVFGKVQELVDWLPERHEGHTGVHIERAQLLSVLQGLIATL